MAHYFAFLCPVCQAEDSINHSKCTQCGYTVSVTPHFIIVKQKSMSLPDYHYWMRKNLQLSQKSSRIISLKDKLPLPVEGKILRISQMAVLRQGRKNVHFKGFRRLFKRMLEIPVPLSEGYLVLHEHHFQFVSNTEIFQFMAEDLTCITTNSHYFEFKVKRRPFFQIEFLHESPLKYEILFQKWLDKYYSAAGLGCIEYQPTIRFKIPDSQTAPFNISAHSRMTPGFIQNLLRVLLRFKLKVALSLFTRVTYTGKNLLPGNYPFIALLNHQSILDPFIILSFLDSRIGFLTKSTSFAHVIERWILRMGMALPTTRFQTDPIVIRHIQNYLQRGLPVGIFAEGERSWDGKMQDFKFSVIRLIVKMRIPVVLIVLQNAFAFLPRWGKLSRSQEIKIQVLAPFSIIPDLYDIRETKTWLENRFHEILDNQDGLKGSQENAQHSENE